MTQKRERFWFINAGEKFSILIKKVFTPTVLFIIILLTGIFARVWQFGRVPPGLNQDEASIGVEAYDLYHFGVDRNGMSYPVNFISWGNGMDALEGYILIPFISLGLTPYMVRLPILLSGILSLVLVYFIARRCFGEACALLSMFLIAISPWHIILSRWGINENIVPFIFLMGYAALMLSAPKNYWFIGSMLIFGLSLYAYGSLYVAIPIFLLCVIPVLVRAKRVSVKNLIIGLCVFAIVVSPIVIFILVNMFGWSTIRLGSITIPRLFGEARFSQVSATSHTNLLKTMLNNGSTMFKLLLINQSDGLIFNSVGQFGYLYPFSFPLAILGMILLFPFYKTKLITENIFLLSWLFAALCIGLFIHVAFNRMQLVFIPIIIYAAAFLNWLGRQQKVLLGAMVCIYLVSFISFNNNYLGPQYYKNASQNFYPGLIPALQYASRKGNNPICVTDLVTEPYIYVLFSDPMKPSTYLDTIQYINPNSGIRVVKSFGRYTFGINNCPPNPNITYVLYYEKPPEFLNGFVKTDFIDFHVYSP